MPWSAAAYSVERPPQALLRQVRPHEQPPAPTTPAPVPRPAPTTPSANVVNFPETLGDGPGALAPGEVDPFAVNYPLMMTAQKAARHAVAALQYNDVVTAVSELERALAILRPMLASAAGGGP